MRPPAFAQHLAAACCKFHQPSLLCAVAESFSISAAWLIPLATDEYAEFSLLLVNKSNALKR